MRTLKTIGIILLLLSGLVLSAWLKTIAQRNAAKHAVEEELKKRGIN